MIRFLKNMMWNRERTAATARGREKLIRYFDGAASKLGPNLPRSGPITLDQFTVIAAFYSSALGMAQIFGTDEFDGIFINTPFDAKFRKRERELSMYHHFQHSLAWGKLKVPGEVLPKVAEHFMSAMVVADYLKDQGELAEFRDTFYKRMAEYGECLTAKKNASTPNHWMAEILAREIFDGENSPRTLRFTVAMASTFSSDMEKIESMYAGYQLRN